MEAAHLAALGVGAAAAGWDLRCRRIPRWLTVPALALGLAYHAWAGGLASAALAAGLGFALGLLLLQLGAVGGGDVKLLAATGAMLGFSLWFWSTAIGFMAAGLTALGQLAWQRRLGFLGSDMAAIARGWSQRGLQPHPEHNLDTPGAVTAPFAVSLGIGMACALLLR
ncbi:MAG: prepilin peptidase [Terriglobales bacterium]